MGKLAGIWLFGIDGGENMRLRIGTRKSKLAMVQTHLVREAILGCFPDVEIELVPISTKGDRHLEQSLTSFGGKGVFTRELEEALLRGDIDMAVHSAKDMPMEFPEGLSLGAVLPRETPGDVLVTTSGISARELPAGSVIGTSSLRRELQIRRMNPQVRIRLLRGNVLTRLDKLRQGNYDGILLAAAGLKRLGITEQDGIFLEYLDTRRFIPAPGQGIMGVEIRQGELSDIMTAIHSPEDAAMLAAERRYLTVLGGSCNAPCGAYCRREGQRLTMSVMFARDGLHSVFQEESVELAEFLEKDEKCKNGLTACEKKSADQTAMMMNCGKKLAERLAGKVRLRPVSLVGAGPGDAGLFTRKGLECVRQAEVIVYDNLISGSILNEAPLEAELIYAGKRSHHHHLTQDEINQLLVEKAMLGKYVVRLKGGDPFIFGRGGEEALALKAQGIPFEIVPGISSSYSVPAYGGIPVTQRGMASSFHVITGHEDAGKTEDVLDYAALAKAEGTLIFLMGLKNLERIAGLLLAHGKPGETPAAVIQQGTTAGQKKAVSTLEHIVEEAKKHRIETPAITIVGDVVRLEDKLDWFGKGLLAGKRILITGSRYMAREMEKALSPYGADTVTVSLIESRVMWTKGLQDELDSIKDYQWAVFTSSNGVDLFFELLKEKEIDLRCLMGLKFAVIGRKTADALKRHGFFCDFVPSGFSGADLAREWIPTLDKGQRALLLRAQDGSLVLTEKLSEAGVAFADVPVYETWVDERRKEELNRVIRQVDYVTVASSSAVRALCGMMEDRENIKARVISIGPSTTKAAQQMGLSVHRTAAEYTAEGIAAAILADVL
ncbi:hydroxymethylbilane synthase [bacterium D16-54]|nr:hydroxymethylbilane synthase [bacterium D16-54]RKJ16301.1 hydroxymethylbilane synthase [bacterium D16-56]